MWPWKQKESSVIGTGMRIRGRIESDGNLTICGQVDGDIVHVGNLELIGEVHGNIQVEGTLVLRSTARLYGDTRCDALQIETGAYFSGTNRMDEVAMPTPAPAQPVSAPAEPVRSPLKVLMEPVGVAEKEQIGTTPKPEASAFYGGFSPAIKGT